MTAPADRKLIPVACTLEGDSYGDRIAEWRAVIAEFGHQRSANEDGVELVFDAAALDTLTRLVEGERACCAWAAWDVSPADSSGEAVLRATAADPAGVAVLHELFA